MKKERLFAGLLAAMMILVNLNIRIFAETEAITVRGTSFTNTISDDKGCAYNDNKEEPIPITAQINVSEAGKYNFKYMGSYGDDSSKVWISKYKITLNGEDIPVPTTAIEVNSQNAALALFDAGDVWLNEGVNTLSFTPTTKRAADGVNFNEYVMLLDYVTFTPNENRTITVKGTSFTNTISDDQGCAYLKNTQEDTPITAQINVSEAGKYNFKYMGSYGDDSSKVWLSKYKITLNGEDIPVPKTAIEVSSKNSNMALFDAGEVFLNKGDNTLSFTPTTKRAADGVNFNEYVILLDYVTFTQNGIRVEGEDIASSESYYPGVVSVTQSSGGKAMSIHEKFTSEKSYELLYNVKAESEGWYNISSHMFRQDVSYTTDALIRVNSGRYLAPKDGVKVSGYSSSLPVYDYSFGKVKLKRGINTIEIKLETDLADGAGAVFFVDYIDLDLITDFALAQIAPDEACGVFENGTGGYTIDFTDKSDSDITFTYKTIDYYGNEKSGTAICAAGSSSAHIDLSDYDNGWYKIEINGAGETYNATFSVVDKYSERYSGDTPFAADFASEHKTHYIQDRRDLARAARLAGVKWMRERSAWPNAEENIEVNNAAIREVTDDINNEGVNVLPVMFPIGSEWHSNANAVKAYNTAKQTVEGLGEKSSTIEIFNEVDGGYTGVPADVYAAFYKAAAIGAIDGGGQSVFAGLISDKKSDFRKLLTANDIMKYSAAYNSHFHLFYGAGEAKETIDTEYITDERDFAAKDGVAKPYWMTEVGMYMGAASGQNASEDKLRHQARYLATAMPEAIASGADKYFWFLWREYNEAGYEMGTFDYNNNPNPVYAAYATVTSSLGKGKFIGQLKSNDVRGYVFETNDKGGQAVALWCNDGEREVTLKTAGDVIVSDMMGRKSTISPTGGTVTINAGSEPVYVIFPNGVNENDYYRKEYNSDKEPITLNEEDKIVFRQEFYENDADRETKLADAKGMGYEVSDTANTTIKLYIANLNNKEETVTLTGKLKGFEVSLPESITIPAMEETSVDVTLIPKKPERGQKLYLSLSGKIGNSECSPSVSAVFVKNAALLFPTEKVAGFEDSANWTKMTGAAKTITKQYVSSSIFDYMQLGITEWAASKSEWIGIKVSDAERAKLYNGLTFSLRTPNGGTSSDYSYSTRLYFDYGDGSYTVYATSLAHAGMPVSSSWRQVTYKWSDFQRMWSPLGGNDTRPMDLSKLAYIAIGGSFSGDSVGFEIGNLGYINVSDDAPVIELEGIEDGGVYTSSAELDNVSITMPEDYKNPIVTINEVPVACETEGDIIKPNLSSLPGGKYRLAVTAQSESGEVKQNTRLAALRLNFTVEQGMGNFGEKIEGENLGSQNLGFSAGSVSENDGRQIGIGCFGSDVVDNAAVQIYVPESGTYKIKYGATRNEDLGWLKPYYFMTNNGTRYQIKDKLQSDYTNAVMAEYECELNLDKGINTLTFVLTDERTDGQKYLIYIDYLDITYVGRKNVTQPEDNQVIVCKVESGEDTIKVTAADTSDNLKKGFVAAEETKDGQLIRINEIKKDAMGSFVPYVVEFDKPKDGTNTSMYVWNTLTEMTPLSDKTDF
ncbi:MAG: hypothetical protein PUF72_12190 [Clostridiales bacterium]|nr:hypothetical protein [Clostridiales bacterium]